jgi:hypothetical protein
VAEWGHPVVPEIRAQFYAGDRLTGVATPAEPVEGAYFSFFPLTIISPMAIASYPNGLTANHRVFRAHTGVTYNIRAAVKGGGYPYTFSLTNAPGGMTIDEDTGEITWVNPTSNATPTLHVEDVFGVTASVAWTITVGTSGFVFLDAVSGSDSNSGTLASPWQTWDKLYDSGTANQIVYVRAGNYSPTGIPVTFDNDAAGEERITWDGAVRPVIWLAYPGDAQPVFDFGYTGGGPPYGANSVPRFGISGPNIFIDGIKFTRSMTMAFQVGHGNMTGTTFRRCWFDQGGPGLDGGNSAFIMFVASELNWGYFTVVQDCHFSNMEVGTSNSVLKLYTLFECLIEDNLFHDIEAYSEGIAVKAGIHNFTIRGNTCHTCARGVVGNMDLYVEADRCIGEVCFNNLSVDGGQPSYALEFNQHGEARAIYYYRNTIRGDILALNVATEDGPFTFDNNVIINGETGNKIDEAAVTDLSRIVLNDNLTGVAADNITDANGVLQGAFRATYLNTMGHEIA